MWEKGRLAGYSYLHRYGVEIPAEFAVRGDPHVHTDLSDGTAGRSAMKQAAAKLGLVPIFTDHDIVEDSSGHTNGDVRGVEASSFNGHLLVFRQGPAPLETVPAGLSARETIGLYREQGHPDDTVVAIAHAGNDTVPSLNLQLAHELLTSKDPRTKVNALEIENGGCNRLDQIAETWGGLIPRRVRRRLNSNRRVIELAQIVPGVGIIGGSDSHLEKTLGDTITVWDRRYGLLGSIESGRSAVMVRNQCEPVTIVDFAKVMLASVRNDRNYRYAGGKYRV